MTRRGEHPWIARLTPGRTLLRAARMLHPTKARGPHHSWLVMLTDGSEVRVRIARPDDARRLEEMHSRCSPESRYLRYFGSASRIPATLLPVLLGLPPDTVALVAETCERRVVGLANLITNDDGTGEVALLVEDSWQRRGLGTALLRRIAALARERHLQALTAVTLPSNGRPARVLARAGLPVQARIVEDVLELRAPIPVGPRGAPGPTSGCTCASRRAPTGAGTRASSDTGHKRPKPRPLHTSPRKAQRPDTS